MDSYFFTPVHKAGVVCVCVWGGSVYLLAGPPSADEMLLRTTGGTC